MALLFVRSSVRGGSTGLMDVKRGLWFLSLSIFHLFSQSLAAPFRMQIRELQRDRLISIFNGRNVSLCEKFNKCILFCASVCVYVRINLRFISHTYLCDFAKINV